MNVPQNFEARLPESCPSCGSRRLIANVRPNANAITVTCERCGFTTRALPHINRRNTSAFYHWALSVKSRDGVKCRICGSRENVNAHHIIPVMNDPNRRFAFNVNNGITLCGRCHRMAHGAGK